MIANWFAQIAVIVNLSLEDRFLHTFNSATSGVASLLGMSSNMPLLFMNDVVVGDLSAVIVSQEVPD